MQFPHLFLGTLKEHYLLLFSAAGVVGLTCGFVGAWIGGFIGARRAVRNTEIQAKDPMTAAQLRGVMDALDSIALEVERIAEAQRFTARLMTERSAPPLARIEKPAITPH